MNCELTLPQTIGGGVPTIAANASKRPIQTSEATRTPTAFTILACISIIRIIVLQRNPIVPFHWIDQSISATSVYDIYKCILPPSSGKSEVQRVRLSLNSCIIRVLSLYDSSLRVSSSAIASSKACLAKWHALHILETK